MLDEHPEEERLVAVLQGGEPDVPLQRVGLAPDVLELERDLLVDAQDLRREEAAQAQRVALLRRERGVLVEDLVAQKLHAAQRDGCLDPGADRGVRRTQRAHWSTS